jgi:hypothetical protein
VNLSDTTEQERQFLEAMATKYSFTGDTYYAFVYRFDQKNRGIINQQLARKISWNSDKLEKNDFDKPNKLRDELNKKICKVLEKDGCKIQRDKQDNTSKNKSGRRPQGQHPWQQAFKWLWDEKFPEWLKQKSIPIPDEQAQKNAVCQFLLEIENRFKYIPLFHTRQPITLENQYIPIQVTLERKYKHEVETIWSYAESEAEIKRVYALKGSEESQRTQVDWTEAKKQLESKPIIVLADPGMGKSTLLRMEAYLTAKKERESLQDNSKNLEDIVFPLFLRLYDIAKDTKEPTAKIIDTISRLIESNYDKHFPEIQTILRDKFISGKCLLLLDSLDEVPKEYINHLFDKLNNFLRHYPCRIICTSRIVGYGGAFLEGLKEVEIVPFNQKQIDDYLKIWFQNADESLNNHSISASSLIRQLQNKPQIRGLTQNPLLLSLICNLYHEQDLTLPTRRCQVYEQAVRYMLCKWRKQRYSEINDGWIDAKIELLEELAYQFSCDNQEVFTIRELRDKIDKYKQAGQASSDFEDIKPSSLIAELSEQDGILQKLHEDKDQYLFLHRTFQEYLTACYLNRSNNGIALAKDHFWDYEWHETLSLMAGLMKDPIPLVEAITHEKDDIFSTLLLLAGKCIAECKSVEHPLIGQIVDRIFQLWCCYPRVGFIESVVVDIGYKYSQIIENLESLLRYKNRKIRGGVAKPDHLHLFVIAIKAHSKDLRVIDSAKEVLSKIGTDKAVDVLISAIEDEDSSVRNEAISALGEISTYKAINILINNLKSKNSDVRGNSARVLGEIVTDEAVDELISTLKDECWVVRQNAAEALGKIGNEKAVKPLMSILIDQEPLVGSMAAVAVGKIAKKAGVDASIWEEVVDALTWVLSEEELNVAEEVAIALAVRFSKDKVDFIPVYPELVGKSFDD